MTIDRSFFPLTTLAVLAAFGGVAAAQFPALPAPPPPPQYAMAALPALAPPAPAQLPPAEPIEPEGGFSGQAADAPKDDLFAGTEVFAKNASDVTEINMDPQSLGMVGGAHAGRAHGMVLNVVRTYSYDKPGLYDMAEVEKFRAKLNTGDWFCSVHTRNMKENSSTDVCQKRRADGMKETAIITVEPRSLTFIHTIRKNDGESSDVTGAPMAALESAPLIAALDAGEMAGLAGEMAKMRANRALAEVNSESMQRSLERLNSPEFKARMDEISARFNSPEFQERMKEMTDRFSSPEFRKKMEDLQRSFRSPEFEQPMQDAQKQAGRMGVVQP